MQQPELKVYEVPTGKLIPYANNAKIHSALQVEQIASSIQEFGFNDPIGVWENKSGEIEIVEGHGRVLAAEKLGIDTVPVIYLNHLSDEQRRAYTHVHNKLTMNSDFDLDVLMTDFEALPDFKWEELGFDMSEFDGLGLDDVDEGPKSKEVNFDDTLGVFVECADEDEQEQIYMELSESGFTCRLLTL